MNPTRRFPVPVLCTLLVLILCVLTIRPAHSTYFSFADGLGPFTVGDKEYTFVARVNVAGVYINETNPTLHDLQFDLTTPMTPFTEWGWTIEYNVDTTPQTMQLINDFAFEDSFQGNTTTEVNLTRSVSIDNGINLSVENKSSETFTSSSGQLSFSFGDTALEDSFDPVISMLVEHRITIQADSPVTLGQAAIHHQVSQTPLPPSALLFATGLVGIAGLRKKIRKGR